MSLPPFAAAAPAAQLTAIPCRRQCAEGDRFRQPGSACHAVRESGINQSGQTEKWYEQSLVDFGLDPKTVPPIMKELIK